MGEHIWQQWIDNGFAEDIPFSELLEEAYQQGREDVINEILNKLTDAQGTIPLVYGTYLAGYIEAIADIINVVEQMKGQKDE